MRKLLIIAIVSVSSIAFAVPQKNVGDQKIEFQPSSQLTEKLLEALKLPLENRIKIINALGSQARPTLEFIAHDKKQTLQMRWRAVTALGRLYPIKSMKVLEEMAQSSEWYLRNAAAIAMVYGERMWAINWSKKLLRDPALVVRTAAVQTLGKLKAAEAEDELWTALYSNINYSNGKSLWIRRHIVEALAHISTYGKQDKFIRVLYDDDKSLHQPAIVGLNKILKGKFSSGVESAPESRKKWLSWWSKNYPNTKTN